MENKGRLITNILLVVVLIALIILVIKDVKNNTQPQDVGQLQYEVTIKASQELAKEYGIDIDSKRIKEFMKKTVGENENMPNDIYEMPNNPQLLRTLLGSKKYEEAFLAPYVENELETLFKEDDSLKITSEEIALEADKMAEYMDSLGINEEDRIPYLTQVLSEQDVQATVERIVAIKYAQVLGEYLDKKDPKYLKSLPFNVKDLDSSRKGIMKERKDIVDESRKQVEQQKKDSKQINQKPGEEETDNSEDNE